MQSIPFAVGVAFAARILIAVASLPSLQKANEIVLKDKPVDTAKDIVSLQYLGSSGGYEYWAEFNTTRDWVDARALCESFDLSLVMPLNRTQAEFLALALHERHALRSGYWTAAKERLWANAFEWWNPARNWTDAIPSFWSAWINQYYDSIPPYFCGALLPKVIPDKDKSSSRSSDAIKLEINMYTKICSEVAQTLCQSAL